MENGEWKIENEDKRELLHFPLSTFNFQLNK